jgi:quinolinate synthase
LRMNREEISGRIAQLKKERNAIILAHNYQLGEVQEIADYVGDSLGLSQKAAAAGEQVIVFCGVHFMAETAAILSPAKTVLLPEISAGCPMADMITAEELREWKQLYPGRKVVAYVNTTAEVKAESDICCTSANALQVVESLPDEEILFVPDKHLAAYVARQTKKRIIAWDGYCNIHDSILASDILKMRRRHPGAEVWAHPECRAEVIDLADKVFSTGKMVKEARDMAKKEIVLGTEAGMVYRLKKENPDKEFYPARESALCPNMKKINLSKVLASLEKMIYKIEVPLETSRRARGAIERMVEL